MNTNQQIEPELLSPIPRKIKLKRNAATKRLIRPLLLAPYLCLGLALMTYLICQTTILLCGQFVTGTITSHQLNKDGARISYTFTLSNRVYHSNEIVSDKDIHLPTGSRVTIKTISAAPALMPMLFKPCGSRITSLFPSWVFAIIWNGAAFVFAWLINAASRHEKRIYTHGIPAMAEIKHKSVKKGDGNTDYTINYTFTVDNGKDNIGTLRWGEDVVSLHDYETIETGRHYTVLYLNTKPLRSALYQFGPYVVSSQCSVKDA